MQFLINSDASWRFRHVACKKQIINKFATNNANNTNNANTDCGTPANNNSVNCGHPDEKWGWAVGAGMTLKMPWDAKDTFAVSATSSM